MFIGPCIIVTVLFIILDHLLMTSSWSIVLQLSEWWHQVGLLFFNYHSVTPSDKIHIKMCPKKLFLHLQM